MEAIIAWIIYVSLQFLELCNCFPVTAQSNGVSPGPELGALAPSLLAALAILTAIVLLAGCSWCRRIIKKDAISCQPVQLGGPGSVQMVDTGIQNPLNDIRFPITAAINHQSPRSQALAAFPDPVSPPYYPAQQPPADNNNVFEDNNNGPISAQELENIVNNNAENYIVSEYENRNLNPEANRARERDLEQPQVARNLSPSHASPRHEVASPDIWADHQEWFDNTLEDFPRNQLQYIQVISRGWFGRIIEGEAHNLTDIANGNSDVNSPYHDLHPVTITRVAVKILDDNVSIMDKCTFLDESRLYRDLRHENLLKLSGKNLLQDPWLILFEYCPLGDLKQYLQSNKSKVSTLHKKGIPLKFQCEIASALEYLHRSNMVHNDIACHSCLVAEGPTAKLGDYGDSERRYPGDYFMAQGNKSLPIRWLPPECKLVSQFSRESNMWSLGVFLWESCSWGELPYEALSDEQVIAEVMRPDGVRLQQPVPNTEYVTYLYTVMQSCWQLDPANRCESAQVSEYLQSLHSNFHRLSSHSEESITHNFDARWHNLKPNTIPKVDNGLPYSTTPPPPEEIAYYDLKFPPNDVMIEPDIRIIHNDGEFAYHNLAISSDTLTGDELSIKAKSDSLNNLHGSFESVQERTSVVSLAQDKPISLANPPLAETSELTTFWESSQTAPTSTKPTFPFTNDSTEKLFFEKEVSQVAPWLRDVPFTTPEDISYIKNVSDVISDFDNMLSSEKTSSSESSHQTSPSREINTSSEIAVEIPNNEIMQTDEHLREKLYTDNVESPEHNSVGDAINCISNCQIERTANDANIDSVNVNSSVNDVPEISKLDNEDTYPTLDFRLTSNEKSMGTDTIHPIFEAKCLENNQLFDSLQDSSYTPDPLKTTDSSKADSSEENWKVRRQCSSGSETEDEIWKKRIEMGTITEKIKMKSKSVTDFMVLTHIDMDFTDLESEDASYNSLENKSSMFFDIIQKQLKNDTPQKESSLPVEQYSSFPRNSSFSLLSRVENLRPDLDLYKLWRDHRNMTIKNLRPTKSLSDLKIVQNKNVAIKDLEMFKKDFDYFLLTHKSSQKNVSLEIQQSLDALNDNSAEIEIAVDPCNESDTKPVSNEARHFDLSGHCSLPGIEIKHSNFHTQQPFGPGLLDDHLNIASEEENLKFSSNFNDINLNLYSSEQSQHLDNTQQSLPNDTWESTKYMNLPDITLSNEFDIQEMACNRSPIKMEMFDNTNPCIENVLLNNIPSVSMFATATDLENTNADEKFFVTKFESSEHLNDFPISVKKDNVKTSTPILANNIEKEISDIKNETADEENLVVTLEENTENIDTGENNAGFSIEQQIQNIMHNEILHLTTKLAIAENENNLNIEYSSPPITDEIQEEAEDNDRNQDAFGNISSIQEPIIPQSISNNDSEENETSFDNLTQITENGESSKNLQPDVCESITTESKLNDFNCIPAIPPNNLEEIKNIKQSEFKSVQITDDINPKIVNIESDIEARIDKIISYNKFIDEGYNSKSDSLVHRSSDSNKNVSESNVSETSSGIFTQVDKDVIKCIDLGDNTQNVKCVDGIDRAAVQSFDSNSKDTLLCNENSGLAEEIKSIDQKSDINEKLIPEIKLASGDNLMPNIQSLGPAVKSELNKNPSFNVKDVSQNFLNNERNISETVTVEVNNLRNQNLNSALKEHIVVLTEVEKTSNGDDNKDINSKLIDSESGIESQANSNIESDALSNELIEDLDNELKKLDAESEMAEANYFSPETSESLYENVEPRKKRDGSSSGWYLHPKPESVEEAVKIPNLGIQKLMENPQNLVASAASSTESLTENSGSERYIVDAESVEALRNELELKLPLAQRIGQIRHDNMSEDLGESKDWPDDLEHPVLMCKPSVDNVATSSKASGPDAEPGCSYTDTSTQASYDTRSVAQQGRNEVMIHYNMYSVLLSPIQEESWSEFSEMEKAADFDKTDTSNSLSLGEQTSNIESVLPFDGVCQAINTHVVHKQDEKSPHTGQHWSDDDTHSDCSNRTFVLNEGATNLIRQQSLSADSLNSLDGEQMDLDEDNETALTKRKELSNSAELPNANFHVNELLSPFYDDHSHTKSTEEISQNVDNLLENISKTLENASKIGSLSSEGNDHVNLEVPHDELSQNVSEISDNENSGSKTYVIEDKKSTMKDLSLLYNNKVAELPDDVSNVSKVSQPSFISELTSPNESEVRPSEKSISMNLHTKTPSMDSWCSNDTLFNVEENFDDACYDFLISPTTKETFHESPTHGDDSENTWKPTDASNCVQTYSPIFKNKYEHPPLEMVRNCKENINDVTLQTDIPEILFSDIQQDPKSSQLNDDLPVPMDLVTNKIGTVTEAINVNIINNKSDDSLTAESAESILVNSNIKESTSIDDVLKDSPISPINTTILNLPSVNDSDSKEEILVLCSADNITNEPNYLPNGESANKEIIEENCSSENGQNCLPILDSKLITTALADDLKLQNQSYNSDPKVIVNGNSSNNTYSNSFEHLKTNMTSTPTNNVDQAIIENSPEAHLIDDEFKFLESHDSFIDIGEDKSLPMSRVTDNFLQNEQNFASDSTQSIPMSDKLGHASNTPVFQYQWSIPNINVIDVDVQEPENIEALSEYNDVFILENNTDAPFPDVDLRSGNNQINSGISLNELIENSFANEIKNDFNPEEASYVQPFTNIKPESLQNVETEEQENTEANQNFLPSKDIELSKTAMSSDDLNESVGNKPPLAESSILNTSKQVHGETSQVFLIPSKINSTGLMELDSPDLSKINPDISVEKAFQKSESDSSIVDKNFVKHDVEKTPSMESFMENVVCVPQETSAEFNQNLHTKNEKALSSELVDVCFPNLSSNLDTPSDVKFENLKQDLQTQSVVPKHFGEDFSSAFDDYVEYTGINMGSHNMDKLNAGGCMKDSPSFETFKESVGTMPQDLCSLTEDYGDQHRDISSLNRICSPGLSDIHFSGPSNDDMMSTSFNEPSPVSDTPPVDLAVQKKDKVVDDINHMAPERLKEWDSESDDSNCSSTSSGDFVWKQKNASSRGASQSFADIPEEEFASARGGYEPHCTEEADSFGEEGDEEDEDEEVEFVPSSWDCRATPTKSALKSPDTSQIDEDSSTSENRKRVMFKKQKYQCIYEYPREVVANEEDDYQALPDYSTYSDWHSFGAGNGSYIAVDFENFINSHPGDLHQSSSDMLSEDDFYISSSTRPFETYSMLNSSSQFFPGQQFSLLNKLKAYGGGASEIDDFDLLPRVPTEYEVEQSLVDNQTNSEDTNVTEDMKPSFDYITPDSGTEDITPGSLIDYDIKTQFPNEEAINHKNISEVTVIDIIDDTLKDESSHILTEREMLLNSNNTNKSLSFTRPFCGSLILPDKGSPSGSLTPSTPSPSASGHSGQSSGSTSPLPRPPSLLGGLRHTRDKLKLDLPPSPLARNSPTAITSGKNTNKEVKVFDFKNIDALQVDDPDGTLSESVSDVSSSITLVEIKGIKLDEKLSTTSDEVDGKSVVSLEKCDPSMENSESVLPDSEKHNIENPVEIISLIGSAVNSETNSSSEKHDANVKSPECDDVTQFDSIILQKSVIPLQSEDNLRKVSLEPVKGEGTLLDSGDEDSGIGSSAYATLERKMDSKEIEAEAGKSSNERQVN